MSGSIGEMVARMQALQDAAPAAATDVASLLGARMRSGSAEARGDTVALVPGGKRDAFLTDAWAADVTAQIGATVARIGGGS